MSTPPTFDDFFRALHGREPFPWQRRLAAEVLSVGWPGMLDLPTGVGKTSALDISLYCLAMAPERMPRRSLLVVDRRIVVDQGAEHARRMQAKMQGATDGPLAAIAARLRALWNADADSPPFAVAVMRGGMPRDNDWAARPDQPVLGVSTVDQVGSRLLFRGYGVGIRSASIHAGLVGNDTLILLDEVHLAVPFAQTLAAIEGRLHQRVEGLPHRFQVVQMSATPGGDLADGARTFGLAPDDLAHPVVQQRLGAHKPAELVVAKVSGDDEDARRRMLAQQLVAAARGLISTSTKVIAVVVNRVDTARHAYRLLAAHGDQFDAALITGRMRPLDRDRVLADLGDRILAGRVRANVERPLIVVATQCIEAGADLDFDALVTECASLDALRQRFGRLDRRGERGTSPAVVAIRSDQVAADTADPVYGTSLSATWAWLASIAQDAVVDFGVAHLPPATTVDGTPRHDLTAPRLSAPVLLPAHVDAWAQTTPRPTYDPDIALWLHGPQRAAADVQVVWRHGMAVSRETSDGEKAALVAHLSGCRPSTLEAATLPLAAVTRWLAGQVPSAVADVMAGDAEGHDDWDRKGNDARRSVAVLRWQGDDTDIAMLEELRPGDVIVLDVLRGGLAAGSFDPDSTARVDDLGDLAQLRGRGIATLRVVPAVMADLGLPPGVRDKAPVPVDDEDPGELRDRVDEWIATWPDEAPPEFRGTSREWTAARAALALRSRRDLELGGAFLLTARVRRRDLSALPELTDALTEDDDSSFRAVEVTLRQHSGDVQATARSFAAAVGLAPALVDDLALAGWLHDVGKADPRFQRWLVGGSEVRAAALAEPLAKSALPANNRAQRRQAQLRAGYPQGYRHELLSLQLIERCDVALASAHDRDLVLHLVASHHGWCRPFAPARDDEADLDVVLEHAGVALSATTRHRLARLDSGVADRFWGLTERYGWWGLAWLEAILRLADHRASEQATKETL